MIVSSMDTSIDVKQRATIVCKTFDNEFTTLTNVATMKAQTDHDVNIFNNMHKDIKNDIETLNICIKVLRQSMEEGKHIYAK